MKHSIPHIAAASKVNSIPILFIICAIVFASAIPSAAAVESQSANTGNTVSFVTSSISSSADLCDILKESNPDLAFVADEEDHGKDRYAAFVTNGSDAESIVGHNKNISVNLDVPAGYKFLIMVRCTDNISSYATISIDTSGSSSSPPSIDLKGDDVFQPQNNYTGYVYFSDSAQSELVCTAQIPDTDSWISDSGETSIMITGHRGYTLLWIEILVYSPSS